MALQELCFKPVNVAILSTGADSRVLVKWDLQETTQDLRNLYFFIDRGESPQSLSQLNADGIPATALREYVDYTANLFDLQKVYYYRVRAVEVQGTTPIQTFKSSVQTWNGALDLVGIYVVEEHLFFNRYVVGVPTMIFKKRHEGARCSECWDATLKRVTKSNCKTCYGTGFYRGYYAPIDAWMNFDPDAKLLQVTQFGLMQPNQTSVMFTNYPTLSVDDVICEVQLNKMWKVSAITTADKNRDNLLQFLKVSAVNPADVEYRLPIPEDRRAALIAELDRRQFEREF